MRYLVIIFDEVNCGYGHIELFAYFKEEPTKLTMKKQHVIPTPFY